eukprot:scaffold422993_cov70-Attheya_sp.AAC.1
MIRCIDDNADRCGGIEKYEAIKEILLSLDRFIDIINVVGERKGKPHKHCEPISSPSHKHLYELLDTLKLFSDWKLEAGDKKEQFIPEQSYEDLAWCVFGLFGVATAYLGSDSNAYFSDTEEEKKQSDRNNIYQFRSGSDVCEHHFSHIRDKNSNPNAHNCQQSSHQGSCANTNSFKWDSKANTA